MCRGYSCRGTCLNLNNTHPKTKQEMRFFCLRTCFFLFVLEIISISVHTHIHTSYRVCFGCFIYWYSFTLLKVLWANWLLNDLGYFSFSVLFLSFILRVIKLGRRRWCSWYADFVYGFFFLVLLGILRKSYVWLFGLFYLVCVRCDCVRVWRSLLCLLRISCTAIALKVSLVFCFCFQFLNIHDHF